MNNDENGKRKNERLMRRISLRDEANLIFVHTIILEFGTSNLDPYHTPLG